MNLSKAKVLVTGAGGFIGSHLVEALLRRGNAVRAFFRYTSSGGMGHLQNLRPELRVGMEPVWGDLRDPDAVRKAVEGCPIVFHLGALIGIPYSYVHPLDYVHVNILGTSHVLTACRERGIQRLVHTSTSEVYGTARYVPIDEKHPLQGQSPYSASKIGADHMVESFVRSFGLPAITVRPFNTYGPRQSTRAVIPSTICQALEGRNPKLGSLLPTRDFSYVDDTVSGMLMAAECDEAVGEVVNLGTGREMSVGDTAKLILQRIDPSLEICSDAQRCRPKASEVERLCANASKAKRLLRWEPLVPIEDGLDRTIAYFREHAVADADRYHV